MGQSSKPTYSKKTENESVPEVKNEIPKSTKTFSSKVHDEFLAQLHEHTVSEYGIVHSIR